MLEHLFLLSNTYFLLEIKSKFYSASSLGRPLVVITFLHRLYLPIFVCCTYFCSVSLTTNTIFRQDNQYQKGTQQQHNNYKTERNET